MEDRQRGRAIADRARLNITIWTAIGVAMASLLVATALVIEALGPDNAQPEPIPRTTPQSTAPAPPQPRPVSLLPPQNEGWLTALSPPHNAVYDIPPAWAPDFHGPRSLFGPGESHAVTGASFYQAALCSGEFRRDDNTPIGGGKSGYSAVAGVTDSKVTDLAQAARDAATAWAGEVFVDSTLAPRPAVTLADPEPVDVGGQPGMRVSATIAHTDCADGRTGVLHAVALPGDVGGSLVFIVAAEQGIPGAVSAAEMEMVLMSIRPADLSPDQCHTAIGTWC